MRTKTKGKKKMLSPAMIRAIIVELRLVGDFDLNINSFKVLKEANVANT